MKSRSAKNKGKRLQNWMMERISDLLGMECGKDTEIASREMGQTGTDVRLIGRAGKWFPFSVECKNQENWSVHSWVDQAKENEKPGRPWLIVAKRNQGKPVIMMDAETFFTMMETINATAEGPVEFGK